jgi:hypothetical protein
MDKLPKIGREGVEAELSAEVGLERGGAGAALRGARALGGRRSAGVRALADAVGGTAAGREGIAELCELLEIVEAGGRGAHVEVDVSIARGLDYYTGTIYETFVRGREAFGSVMSGGRYDTLLGMFLRDSIPAVGISLGIDRLVSLLADLGLVTARAATAEVYAAVFDDEGFGPMVRAAASCGALGWVSRCRLRPASSESSSARPRSGATATWSCRGPTSGRRACWRSRIFRPGRSRPSPWKRWSRGFVRPETPGRPERVLTYSPVAWLAHVFPGTYARRFLAEGKRPPRVSP